MTLPRRQLLRRVGHLSQGAAGLSLSAATDWLHAAPATEPPHPSTADERVLRYAFPTAETSFDPQAISDIYSRYVTAHIFEALYDYDPLARPFKIIPTGAEALPDIADNFRTFTIRLRRGVFFQDDPAFKGQRREVTADDWVYTLQRLYDPATRSPAQSSFEDDSGIIGLQEARDAAIRDKRAFDYHAPLPGLQVLDRYTLRCHLRESRPRFVANLAAPDIYGVMAREVVAFYGDKIGEHPVGTGPFRLQSWRRSSQIVLARHPTYRERVYDAQPNPEDAEGQALLKQFQGRRLPMLDRVEISIIEEAQPRWLSFLNGEQDMLQIVPPEFVPQAIPGGQLAPHLAKRGVRKYRVPASDVNYLVFNCAHPVIGGNAPERVALRRAVGMAHDVQREITLARRGEAVPAHSMTVPNTTGYEPGMRSDATMFNPVRARALLDTWGYVDRDGDGWREGPDGRALTLELLAQSDQTSRALDEVFQKSMAAVGLRVALKIGQWGENLRACQSGQFMLWRVGSSASSPDGQSALERAYGGSIGKANIARFSLPAFDRVFDQLKALPDGPERAKLFHEANRLVVSYMPYRMTIHRIVCDLTYPRVQGYRRPPYWLNWLTYVDVDPGPPRKNA